MVDFSLFPRRNDFHFFYVDCSYNPFFMPSVQHDVLHYVASSVGFAFRKAKEFQALGYPYIRLVHSNGRTYNLWNMFDSFSLCQ